jgi:hypothetical protein
MMLNMLDLKAILILLQQRKPRCGLSWGKKTPWGKPKSKSIFIFSKPWSAAFFGFDAFLLFFRDAILPSDKPE